jgi:nicotinamidase-related amidase
METMTLTSPQTKEQFNEPFRLEACKDVDDIAMISVDNIRTFEDASLNELYVTEGEQAASVTKNLLEACKYYKITTINVLEKHPLGHISLAANYKNKNPYDLITNEEVQTRTEEEHGIGERAQFTLSELKKFLSEVKEQRLRPDHSIQNTEGVELTQPLQTSDFDLEIVKGTNPAKEAYSGFDDTTLDDELKQRNKKILLISGVATDYCVGKTAEDALNKNYTVYLISDAIKGVAQTSTNAMIQTLKDRDAEIITSARLFEILQKHF